MLLPALRCPPCAACLALPPEHSLPCTACLPPPLLLLSWQQRAPTHPPHPLPLRARRGISNTAGTVAGVVGVAVTGYVLQWAGGAQNSAGWYQAFAAAAVQCVAGSLVYLRFARGERLFGGDVTHDHM